MANKRRGRPASGPAGEKVSRYPALTVRLPRQTKDSLLALAAIRREPAWKTVDVVVRSFIARMDPERRAALEIFVENLTRNTRRNDA